MNHQSEIDTIIARFRQSGAGFNETPVYLAIQLAILHHGTQKRASGEPFFYHPIEVAAIIADMRLDTSSIVAAILHDTIEDTDLTLEEVRKHFGNEIAKLVDGVTKLAKIKFREQHVEQAENFRKILLAMSDDIRILLVKLADRLHNMRTLHFLHSKEKRQRIALETIEVYAPLAERIGMHQLKTELQEIGFKELNPEAHEAISKRFEILATGKDQMIEKIIQDIQRTVTADGTKAFVTGRRKTPYSTWIKMQEKDMELEQLSDIIGFRVIVDNVTDCYKVLGFIHQAYKMVPKNFDDFISIPKNNGYQSIHTVVLGPSQDKIEIQIRTQDMHNIAEFGVAAHWSYKQKYEKYDGKKYAWIRELIASLTDSNDPLEFIQNTKLTMYYDQVFCFTLHGNLLALPRDATVIDFAYVAYAEKANRFVGAKINGVSVPLSTKLVNGDQVEIITSKTRTVSGSWERIAVTGTAKAQISKALRLRQQKKDTTKGKKLLQATLAKHKIQQSSALIQFLGEFYRMNAKEFLYNIGTGRIAIADIAQIIESKLHSNLSNLNLVFKADEQKSPYNYSVLILGKPVNMFVNFAKCCYPIPPDEIVGSIRTKNAIMIHATNCKMLNNFINVHEKIVELTWNDALDLDFSCRIKMLILEGTILPEEITASIEELKVAVTYFRIVASESNYFALYCDLQIKSFDDCIRVMTVLKEKNGIQNLERVRA